VLSHNVKKGNISSPCIIIKMIMAWLPSGPSVQSHMAVVHMLALGEQLKGQQKGKSAKPLTHCGLGTSIDVFSFKPWRTGHIN
jgi:hypothetical protein